MGKDGATMESMVTVNETNEKTVDREKVSLKSDISQLLNV